MHGKSRVSSAIKYDCDCLKLDDSGNCIIKVGDNSLIIHKSAYHLFSVFISKRGFSSLQTRKTFVTILSGNYRFLRLQLHDAIYHPDSFVLMLRYCANLKAIRYESTSLNRIVADKSHRVIVA